MINMQASLPKTFSNLLGINNSYKDTLDKQTKLLNKLQARHRKALEERERVSQEVSLLNLQIEAQARLLRDL